MSNLPATQNANTVAKLFENPALKKQLQMAIPKHMTVERLLRVAMTALRVNPKLMECSQQSLLAAIMGCAQLGLEPEPFLGQAYLVPFKKNSKDASGKWQSTTECQLIPGYRGYIALARRSGELQSLSAQVVYENDDFELQFGLEEKLNHVPAEGDRGEVKGAYVVFRYKDGSHSFDYMPKDDIDAIRERSKSKDNGPWVTDYGEMAKKTVIRRHVKVAPLSVELAKAAMSEDMALSGKSQIDMFLPDAQIQAPQDQTEYIPFDDLTAGRDNKDRIEEFAAFAASANGTTVEQLKESAAKDFDNFLKAFAAWDRKNPPIVTETTLAPEKVKFAPAPCPNLDGEKVPKAEECDECDKREGCPVWE